MSSAHRFGARRGRPAVTRVAAVLTAVVVIGSLLAACGSASSSPSPSAVGIPSGSGPLTIFAAASLRDAFTAAKAAYEAANPDVSITLSFDASSALRAQIEQGAPVDLFASADVANAQAIVTDHLAAGPATPFANNDLVVVVPKGNPANITSPKDLARPGIKYVAAGEAVPITVYANQVIARLATLSGYPSNYVAAVSANTISREDNVRAVLAKVELGEADAGIVYGTDAASTTKVKTIAIPAAAQVTAHYAAVVIARAANGQGAADFLRWLTAPDGQAVMARFGFRPPGKT